MISGVFPRLYYENSSYTVKFYNTMPYRVKFYWVDFEGIKHVKYVGEKSYYLIENTYFSHPWVFKSADVGNRLNVSFSNLSNQVFEGKEFKVKMNSTNHATISDQGNLAFIIRLSEMRH